MCRPSNAKYSSCLGVVIATFCWLINSKAYKGGSGECERVNGRTHSTRLGNGGISVQICKVKRGHSIKHRRLHFAKVGYAAEAKRKMGTVGGL